MTAKFTQKDLEKLENEQELKAYRWYQRNWQDPYYYGNLPPLTDKEEKDFIFGIKKCSPTIWQFLQRRNEANQRVQDFPVILHESNIKEFETIVQELETHFPGKGQTIGQDAMVYKRFKTNTEIFIEAVHLFYDQFQRLGGFGGGSFEQLFSSMRLGLYSAVDNCVTSRAGLNYPDHQDPSPRLQAVKKYLEKVYFLRVRFQVLDAFVRLDFFPKDIPGFTSQGQWFNFLNDVRERLSKKFGKNSSKIFTKIFGSDNPPPPNNQTEFNFYQEQILTWIAKIGVVSGNPDDTPINLEEIPNQDGFHRDYAKEQRDREERQRQEEERQRREHPDWANINPDFKNNPDLQKSWAEQGFDYETAREWMDIGLKPKEAKFAAWLKDTKKVSADWVLNESDLEKLKEEFREWETKPEEEKQKDKNNNIDNKDDEPKPNGEESKDKKRDKSPSRQAAEDKLDGKETKPPKHTEFNSSDLNEALNSLNGALEEDKKNNPETFDGRLPPLNPNMPITQESKEAAAKRPWLVMGVSLAQSERWDKGFITGVDSYPFWKVFSPHNIPFTGGGSGDFVTLQLELCCVERVRINRILGNFFWAKNFGTEQNPIKGFQRLVKDNTLEREREREQRQNPFVWLRHYRYKKKL